MFVLHIYMQFTCQQDSEVCLSFIIKQLSSFNPFLKCGNHSSSVEFIHNSNF